MENNPKIIKLSNGDEIITVIASAQSGKGFIEVENPLKVNLYPKMLEGDVVESMALSRWLTVSENQICNLNKNSIVAIAEASVGLNKFYEYCIKKMHTQESVPWEEPTDEELDEIAEQEEANILPFRDPNKTYH